MDHEKTVIVERKMFILRGGGITDIHPGSRVFSSSDSSVIDDVRPPTLLFLRTSMGKELNLSFFSFFLPRTFFFSWPLEYALKMISPKNMVTRRIEKVVLAVWKMLTKNATTCDTSMRKKTNHETETTRKGAATKLKQNNTDR